MHCYGAKRLVSWKMYHLVNTLPFSSILQLVDNLGKSEDIEFYTVASADLHVVLFFFLFYLSS